MKTAYVFLASTLFSSALALSGCSSATPNTIVDVAQNAGTFTTLTGALTSTGLDTTLRGAGPFTVFAPTDSAFALLPAGLLASVDKATLTKVLTYHVYSGRAAASDVVGLDSVDTVEGGKVSILANAQGVWLNAYASVTTTDIAADNGIIHVIDAVLVPPSMEYPGTIVDALKGTPTFSTLVGAVVRADLATTLAGDNSGNGFTVFAPTNRAFEALGVDVTTLDVSRLSGILLRHVASGKVPDTQVVQLTQVPTLSGASLPVAASASGVTLDNKARVIQTNLRTSNGIIHIIDAVLTP